MKCDQHRRHGHDERFRRDELGVAGQNPTVDGAVRLAREQDRRRSRETVRGLSVGRGDGRLRVRIHHHVGQQPLGVRVSHVRHRRVDGEGRRAARNAVVVAADGAAAGARRPVRTQRARPAGRAMADVLDDVRGRARGPAVLRRRAAVHTVLLSHQDLVFRVVRVADGSQRRRVRVQIRRARPLKAIFPDPPDGRVLNSFLIALYNPKFIRITISTYFHYIHGVPANKCFTGISHKC